MILHFSIVAAMALTLFLLVRNRLLQVDLSFPWFVGIVVLGFASIYAPFVHWLSAVTGILHPPTSVVVVALIFALGAVIANGIGLTRLRRRQQRIIMELALRDLAAQEERMQKGVAGSDTSTRSGP